MKDTERKKVQYNNQTKRPVRTPRRESKTGEENGRKLVTKETPSKASRPRPSAVNNTSVVTEPSEAYEDVVIHYVDDANRSENAVPGHDSHETVAEGNEIPVAKGDDSDHDSLKDSSSSSQGDSVTADDEKLERDPSFPRKLSKNGSRTKIDHERNKMGAKELKATPKKSLQSNSVEVPEKDDSENSWSSSMNVFPSLLSSEGIEEKKMDEEKDEDVFKEVSNGAKSTESDDEIVTVEDNKVEIMKNRIEKLEEELREVAALEISLYSVIPEHGRSSHKMHTPARRLSRLYIHACKYLTRSKRATIARNTVSGIILVTKTCGNDLQRSTFWLSNTVVLREIISQAFGISSTSSARFTGPNGSNTGRGGNVSASKLKERGKQVNKTCQPFEDWEETSTFTSALEKIESWIFSRVVESVWWQVLTPNMLSPVEELISQKSMGKKILGPALGDQQQGTFSIELWKTAFQTAFQRLCPVRAAGHECGCLPVLARKVMKQCIARLDVAMFNAILRESASQIPTDPVSDPIVDSKVLPIPAGEFSFGSGAQLKNAVGNWSRCFENTFGVEIDHLWTDRDSEANDDHHSVKAKTECFCLLNELSDLLMLPKDLLMDNSIREEVCPSINLDVITRVLCYFTPDEFCPDPVPGEVLESLNVESFVERRFAGESAGSFPYAADAVLYCPPSTKDVSEKVSEAGGKPHLNTNVSMVLNKGYTSDDDLHDLDSPPASLIEPTSPSTLINGKLSLKDKEPTVFGGNARYELLREVWSL